MWSYSDIVKDNIVSIFNGNIFLYQLGMYDYNRFIVIVDNFCLIN